MDDNTAYDITSEIDPVETLDAVEAKLARRRQEREQTLDPKPSSGHTTTDAVPSESQEDREAQKKSEARKRAAEAARKKREASEREREERRQELADSRWITAGHKVREKRVEHLDRVFYRLKSEGNYSGTKQEFFDEGLAMLEEKYDRDAEPASAD